MLGILLVVFSKELAWGVSGFAAIKPSDAILLALSLIDLSLIANLLLIVILAGYENFVGRIDSGSEQRPGWMGTIDFSGMKMKLLGSIIAISSIAMLRIFPVFGDGNTVTAILVASAGIWLFHFMILRGIQQAAVINTIVTFAKIIPILVFILIMFLVFKLEMFRFNFYGAGLEGGIMEQVKATMFVTVFVFLGIEGASVYSRYARERRDVGFATITGFLSVTALMVFVTLLPYASLVREEIAGIRQPSMAGVLEAVVGPWGAVFVSVGLIVSVLGAYLAWSLICAEVMSAAARNKDMPALFARENANKVPHTALWASNIVVQAIVITTYWSIDAFSLMLNLTSAMALIPFLLVAGYSLQLTRRGETYAELRPGERNRDLVVAIVATIYTAFLLWAGGMTFIVLSATLYAPGSLLYLWARREQGKPAFAKTSDKAIGRPRPVRRCRSSTWGGAGRSCASSRPS